MILPLPWKDGGGDPQAGQTQLAGLTGAGAGLQQGRVHQVKLCVVTSYCNVLYLTSQLHAALSWGVNPSHGATVAAPAWPVRWNILVHQSHRSYLCRLTSPPYHTGRQR